MHILNAFLYGLISACFMACAVRTVQLRIFIHKLLIAATYRSPSLSTLCNGTAVAARTCTAALLRC
jgi:hypothetical protein